MSFASAPVGVQPTILGPATTDQIFKTDDFETAWFEFYVHEERAQPPPSTAQSRLDTNIPQSCRVIDTPVGGQYRYSLSNFDNLKKTEEIVSMSDKDLYSGLIRLHILYHAGRQEIFGLGIIEELARHGYKLSPGTVYPILHGLERKGYLRSWEHRDGRRIRRVYRATPVGRNALAAAKVKVQELVGELFEDEPAKRTDHSSRKR